MTCKTTDTEAVVEEALICAARALSIPYRSALVSSHRKAVLSRAIAMVWATQEMGHTLTGVGEAMGLDHSTVHHHKAHHEARIQSEKLYREGWKEVEAELRD
jgi:chromosomal replication initiation ATPase DnaA